MQRENTAREVRIVKWCERGSRARIDPVQRAVDAAFPGLPQGMTMGEAERRVRAAIAAYLQACAERDGLRTTT